MGRAHHDGQQLEHLPERRLGKEAQPSDRRPKNSQLPNLGSKKTTYRAFYWLFE